MIDHDVGPPGAQRGRREALGLLARMTVTTTVVLFVTVVACAFGDSVLDGMRAVGEEVVAEASWFYPTVLTGALAYVGVPFAQLLVNADGRAMARIRRLTPVVETTIAGVTTAATLLAWVAAANDPTLWPHMWSIVLLWGSVTVVAFGVGRMVLGNAEERLRVAEYELAVLARQYGEQCYRQRSPDARRKLTARVVFVMVTATLSAIAVAIWSERTLILRDPVFVLVALGPLFLSAWVVAAGLALAVVLRDRAWERKDRLLALVVVPVFGVFPAGLSTMGWVWGDFDFASVLPALIVTAPLLCFVPGLGGVGLVGLVRQVRTTNIIDRLVRVAADVKALREYLAERAPNERVTDQARVVVEHTVKVAQPSTPDPPRSRSGRIGGRPRQRAVRRPRS